MAVQEDIDVTVKKITDNIESTYQSLRKVARNLSGLLAVGRATCDEIKAYNLYAVAVYDTQRGMLATLRAKGQNVPALPPTPTLFAWKGVSGDKAFQIDCKKEANSLQGSLAAAMASSAQPDAKFLSAQDIQVVSQDPNVFFPERTSLAQIAQQGANAGLGGELGIAPVIVIVIAAIAIAVAAIAIPALMQYLKEKEIQEETTARTKLQAQAFENYTATRMSCYDSCISKGNTIDSCIKTCKGLVDKPQLDVIPRSGLTTGSPLLQKVGLIAVAGIGALILLKLHRSGVFEGMFRSRPGRRHKEVVDIEDEAED